MGEYDALGGEENGVIVIDRDRFELDDETLSGLTFEIENESVARLSGSSADEILMNGIEIQLLAEGETKLVIRQKGEAEPLREIRLVVTAAPAAEPEEPVEEVVSEPETLPDAGTPEDEFDLDFGGEIVLDEVIS